MRGTSADPARGPPGRDPCPGALAPFISKSAFTISWRSCRQMP